MGDEGVGEAAEVSEDEEKRRVPYVHPSISSSHEEQSVCGGCTVKTASKTASKRHLRSKTDSGVKDGMIHSVNVICPMSGC